MEIEIYELPPIGTNCFFLRNPVTGEAAVVDAPLGAFDLVQQLLTETDSKLVALLMTHGHWDHILDAWQFDGMAIEVMGHRDDELLYSDPHRMMASAVPGLEMKPVPINRWVGHSETFDVIGEKVEIRHVPGHCPGNVVYWFRSSNVAFVGDAIFCGGIGRYDLPGGNFKTLEKSIREQIYTLPDSTVLYPGHGPETTVADEYDTNPYVRPE